MSVLEVMLALRLSFDGASGRRTSRPAVRVARLGVAIGLMVMLLSISITDGFKREIHEKISGFTSHMRIYPLLSGMGYGASNGLVLDDSLQSLIQRTLPDLKHVQRYSQKAGVLKTDSAFQGILLKGVGQEFDASFLSRHLVAGEIPAFSDTVSSWKAVMSLKLARMMGLSLGDRFDVYFMDDEVRIRRLEVAGIFETHLEGYDSRFILTDLRTVGRLLGLGKGQCEGLEVSVEDFDRMEEASEDLATVLDEERPQDIHLIVENVRQANMSMFSWLDILDMNIYIILLLMILVSGFTMAGGILIILLERTSMIGTLKALGATDRMLTRSFLLFGGLMILRGMLWGNLLWLGFALLQDRFGLLRLDAATYYMDRVPVALELVPWILTNLLCLFSLLLFILLPLRLIARVRPSETIRYQ